MKLKKSLSKPLYFLVIAIACFFGIQVASILIVTPILAFYGFASNSYILTGNTEYFVIAASATKVWLSSLVIFCLSALFVKLIKTRREKNE